MKKILFLSAILLLCTGCNDSITCKEKGTNNSYYIEVTSNDKIDKIVLHYEVSEPSEKKAKETEKQMREQFSNAENFKNAKINRNGKLIKMDVEVLYYNFFTSDEKSLKEVKSYFEKQLGMKCYE